MNPISGRAGPFDLLLIRSSISWGDRVAKDVGITSPKTWRKSWFGTFGPLVIQRRLVLTAGPWAVINIVSSPLRRHPGAAKGRPLRPGQLRDGVDPLDGRGDFVGAPPSPIYNPLELNPSSSPTWRVEHFAV
jgi:hypothetical protein